jgi:hypothetical protein
VWKIIVLYLQNAIKDHPMAFYARARNFISIIVIIIIIVVVVVVIIKHNIYKPMHPFAPMLP